MDSEEKAIRETPAKGSRGFILFGVTRWKSMTFRQYDGKGDFVDHDVHHDDLTVRIEEENEIDGKTYHDAMIYEAPGKWIIDYPRKALSAGGRIKKVPHEGCSERPAHGLEGRLIQGPRGRWNLAVPVTCTEPGCNCGILLATFEYQVRHEDLEVEITDKSAAFYERGDERFIGYSSAAMRVVSKDEAAAACAKGRARREAHEKNTR